MPPIISHSMDCFKIDIQMKMNIIVNNAINMNVMDSSIYQMSIRPIRTPQLNPNNLCKTHHHCLPYDHFHCHCLLYICKKGCYGKGINLNNLPMFLTLFFFNRRFCTGMVQLEHHVWLALSSSFSFNECLHW